MLPERIFEIEKQGGFPLWLGVGLGHRVITIRLSGFLVSPDRENIEVVLPLSLRNDKLPPLADLGKATLLMASMQTFESYQIKGGIVSEEICTEENSERCLRSLVKTIGFSNEMQLPGQDVFGLLMEVPLVQLRLKADKVYVQTPLPNTGNAIT